MDAKTVGEKLREPFPYETLGWKPQMVKNDRALAICYIDARDVMQRLDDVVGVENWQDDYSFLPGGGVMCHLRVCFDGAWVTKCDVGGESEQPDKGDREKAAVSDALKRAAVKFGIGRYLYAMPSVWCDYDPVKKQFKETPRVAAQFLPPAPPKATGPRPQQPAPAQQKAPVERKEYPDFFGFLDQIATATDLPALQGVWGDVLAAHGVKLLTETQLKELATAKDARKGVISNPDKALFDNRKPVGAPH